VGFGVYPTWEPGEQRRPRTKRLTMAAVAAAAFIGLGGCAGLLLVPKLIAEKSLDPAINTHTGLPDGTYVMTATASFHRGDQCWFRGNPQGAHLSATDAPEITVYGTGAIPCAGATYGQVSMTVTDGNATITRSNP
jgi:hypothetical protein